MSKIKIKILNKGDTVLFVNDRIIAIQRKNGEVDLIPLILDENNLPRIDTENIVTITYGKNSIESITNGDNGDVQITTF